MYSRNRSGNAASRYEENIPPVYSGSRFYRGTGGKEAPQKSTEMRPVGGVPVTYEAKPSPAPLPPPEVVETCQREVCEPLPQKTEKREGLLPALFSDTEEVLLIALLLLFAGEGERSSDMIVILLLLMVIR